MPGFFRSHERYFVQREGRVALRVVCPPCAPSDTAAMRGGSVLSCLDLLSGVVFPSDILVERAFAISLQPFRRFLSPAVNKVALRFVLAREVFFLFMSFHFATWDGAGHRLRGSDRA